MPPIIEQILINRKIEVLFQPIVSLNTAKIIGFECLSRGPSDTPLISFPSLFAEARKHNRELDLEYLCHKLALKKFSELDLPGMLFLNLTPGCLVHPEFNGQKLQKYIRKYGLNADKITIELTENHPDYEKDILLEALDFYHTKNFKIAMDDLGEGISSLRLWLDLRPEFVKIDKYFIQGIAIDELKQEFMKSIANMARKAGTGVIAEGIENQADLMVIKKIGIDYGQGYYFARPESVPENQVPVDIAEIILNKDKAFKEDDSLKKPNGFQKSVSGGDLLKETIFVSPQNTNEETHEIFCSHPELFSIPVVKDGVPVGMVTRFSIIDKLARPYCRELYGKKPCTMFMDKNPLIVDQKTTIQKLSQKVVDAGRRFLIDGYIITDRGLYLGMGTGHDLMKKITEMQINAARYANPLTLLPGNVPIHQELDKSLQNQISFTCVYFDLDNFKPFNDKYGFERGDKIIVMVGEILSSNIDQNQDFLGHIGGDDFICLFRSEDWELRCRKIISCFEREIKNYFVPEDIENGGYYAEDRKGNKVFHSLLNISIGALRIGHGHFNSHKEIASVAAEAKKMAKQIPENSLYIDRRFYGEKESSSLEKVFCNF